MKKFFLPILAAIILALPGCSKSGDSYEAIYYILMTGPTEISCGDPDIKTQVEDIIQSWKNSTEITWRVDFGKSYTDADVSAKDAEAVSYYTERVNAFDTAIQGVRQSIAHTSVEIDHTWHFSVCRDKSSNTLATSRNVSIIHHP